jgi:hypothetical protein
VEHSGARTEGNLLQVIRVKTKTLSPPDNHVAALRAMIAESCPGTELIAATSSGVGKSATASSAASQSWHSLTSSAKATTQTTSVSNSRRLQFLPAKNRIAAQGGQTVNPSIIQFGNS